MEHTTRVLWYLARRAAGVRWSSASFKNANARGNKLAQEVRGAVVQHLPCPALLRLRS